MFGGAISLAALEMFVSSKGMGETVDGLALIDKTGKDTALTLDRVEDQASSLGRTFDQKVVPATASSHKGFGKVEKALAGVAIGAAGADPKLAKVASILLQFGAGGAVTGGMIAGGAIIALVWAKMTEGARKYKEEVKKAQEASDSIIASQNPDKQFTSSIETLAKRQAELRKQMDHALDVQEKMKGNNMATEEISRRIHVIQAEMLKNAERLKANQSELNDLKAEELKLVEEIEKIRNAAGNAQVIEHNELWNQLSQLGAGRQIDNKVVDQMLQGRVNPTDAQLASDTEAKIKATQAEAAAMAKAIASSKMFTESMNQIQVSIDQTGVKGWEASQKWAAGISLVGNAVVGFIQTIQRGGGFWSILGGLLSTAGAVVGTLALANPALAGPAAALMVGGALFGSFGGKGDQVGHANDGARYGGASPTGYQTNDYSRQTVNSSAYKSPDPVQAIHVTVIGPNDPSAQRAIMQLVGNAQRRGLT